MVIDEKLQSGIDEILDYFDFEKVHRAMKAVDWKWEHGKTFDNDLRIPDILTLRQTARRLMKSCIREENKETATGGFQVRFDKEEHYLSLSFVISEWYYCGNEDDM